MVEFESNYIEAVRTTKEPFVNEYNDTDNKDNSSVDFTIRNVDSDDWVKTINDVYTYVISKKSLLPEQGWKIHISSVLNEAQNILLVVSHYLINNDISFKFLNNSKLFIQNNSKYADRSESGKFITIYPKEESQFIKILEDLQIITDTFKKGPYILSDKRFKDGNIYYRYGAFQNLEKRINGKMVSCIRNLDGKLVPDQRLPHFVIPNFIKEPDELVDMNSDNIESDFHGYSIEKALHFSNGGGVYLASKNQKQYVIKEGRPQSGLDGKLSDGFDRVNQEYIMLKSLKGVPGVIKVRECFKVWEHNYMVEDIAVGETLHDFVMYNYPFSNQESNSKKSTKYLNVVKEIYRKLRDVVEKIHENGISIGDIHPDNIIINKTDREVELTIIDLEAATENGTYHPKLATPKFSSFNENLTSVENDWFSVYKVIYYLLVPTEITSTLIPEIHKIQKKYVSEHFGAEGGEFLQTVDLFLARNSSFSDNFLKSGFGIKLPHYEISLSNKEKVVNGVRNGILQNLDYNSQYLIKQWWGREESNIQKYCVAMGTFGTIMALNRTGTINDNRKFYQWQSENIDFINFKLNTTQEINGLFNGVYGIASVLDDLNGKLDNRLQSKLLKHDIDNMYDISLYSGLAGIGLYWLSYYTIYERSEYLEKSICIAKRIIELTNENKLENYNFGLLDGIAGSVLFFDQLFQVTNDVHYKKIALNWMDEILNEYLVMDKDEAFIPINDGSNRLSPYLNNGSAGVILVMIELNKHNKHYFNDVRISKLEALIKACDISLTGHSCFFDGYGGFLILGNVLSNVGINSDLIYKFVNGLNIYAGGFSDKQILFSDYNGLTFSMNLHEGASGILLGLDQIGNKDWSEWLPLPQKNKLDLFKLL